MLGPVLDSLFPKRCAGCGAGPWPFCGECAGRLVPLAPPWCLRCGAPAARNIAGCADCPPGSIRVARSPFRFEGPIRSAVHRLKFAGWRQVAGALGAAMIELWDQPVDAVTWVPLSRRRMAARGYDQARALALAVAPRLGAPAVGLLVRAGDPGPQARRGGEARRQAMRGMFLARGRPGPRVLLVDDVLTTGATAGACAESLLSAGAASVGLLTAARAVSRPGRPILEPGLASGSVVARGTSPR